MSEISASSWTSVDDRSVAFLCEIQGRLLGVTSATELLETAVALVRRVPGTIGAWVYQRDEMGTFLLVHNLEAEGVELAPIDGADLGKLLHQRWIAAHRLGHSETEFAYPFAPAGAPSQIVSPMLLGEELIGAIVAERRDGAVFPYAAPDIAAIATIAAMTAQGLQMLALRGRLLEQDQQTVVDQERRHLSRVLHDGIVQDLAYLQVKLEILEQSVESRSGDAAAHARQLREQIGRSITSLRTTISELRRPRRSARGLTGQLRDLTVQSYEHRLREFDLGELTGTPLAPEIERAVIGIIREALQNIRKHANASDITIELQREDEELRVTVADDGVGISRDLNSDREGHFGMEQMRELAEDLGGSLRVESAPGMGTRVQARIPLVLEQRSH